MVPPDGPVMAKVFLKAIDDAEKEQSMAAGPLQRFADAYGVPSTLDAVADAIILRTQIPAGVNERGPVLEVVAMLIRDPDTLLMMSDHEAADR